MLLIIDGMAVKMRIFFFFVLLIFLGGCNTLPKSNKVEAFGKAATAGISILDSAVKTNQEFGFFESEQNEAINYINCDRDVQLPNCDDFNLFVTPQTILDKDPLGVRRQALIALSNYAVALQNASNNENIEALEKASVALGEAVGGAIVVASPVAAPVAAPAAKFVSRGIGLLLGNA